MQGLHDLCVGLYYVSLETGIPPKAYRLLLQQWSDVPRDSHLRPVGRYYSSGQMYPEIPT